MNTPPQLDEHADCLGIGAYIGQNPADLLTNTFAVSANVKKNAHRDAFSSAKKPDQKPTPDGWALGI